jgi:DNA-binding MarR family transcriptional regulator
MNEGKSGRHTVPCAFLLTQIGTRAAQEFGRKLAPLNLAPPDAGILRLLALSPGISQQELARRLEMHASRLVAVIDSLEERGLVTRNPNSEDRRLYSLALTEPGKTAMGEIGRISREHDDAVCSALNAKEREQLGALLEQIASSLGLAPGIHPGYRNLQYRGPGSAPAEKRGQPPGAGEPGCE